MITNLLRPDYISNLCCGNPEAMDFLVLWTRYAHEVDDIVDGDRTGREEIIATFALAIELYSHPFYISHLLALRQIFRNVTNMYADTVAWEKSPLGWRREVADALRCCGNEVTFAVAIICGGYDHARKISADHRTLCWHNQHDPEPQPKPKTPKPTPQQ